MAIKKPYQKVPTQPFSKERIGYDTSGNPVYKYYNPSPIEVSQGVTYNLGTGEITGTGKGKTYFVSGGGGGSGGTGTSGGGGGVSVDLEAQRQAELQLQAEEQARLEAQRQAQKQAQLKAQETKLRESAIIKKQSAGLTQAIERVKSGKELTQVDLFNLTKEAERTGYTSYGGKGGARKVAGEEDIKRFIENIPQEIREVRQEPTASVFTPPTTPFTPYLKKDLGRESSIGVWKPEYESQYYKKPISQVGREFVGILKEDVKTIFGGSTTPLNLVNPFESFKGYGKRESEVKSPQYSSVLKIGSISPDEAPYKTYGELQGEVELNYLTKVNEVIGEATKKQETIVSELKDKINTGEMNVEEANRLLNEKNIEINRQIEKDLSKIKKVDYYSKSKQTGESIVGLSRMGVETVSLLNPATATLMAAYKFSKLPTTDETQFYNKQTGKVETLYPTEKATFGEKAEASSYLIFGGLSSLGKARQIEKEIVSLELEEASKQPIRFKELQIIGRDETGTKVLMKGESKFRGLTTEVDVAGKVYPEGVSGRGYIMPTGTGEARISGETSWTLFGGGKPTYIAGVQEFEVGAKGLSFDIGKGKLTGEAINIIKPNIAKANVPDTILLYHVTTEKNVPNILKEGLIPSKTKGIIGESDKVFTSISKKTAEGYKIMRGEEATILNINVPKEKFYQAVREEGVGTIGQVKFSKVPKEWIEKPKDLFMNELTATAKPFIRGKAFGTIGTSTVIPTESTSIIFTTETAKPYVNFPFSDIKYISNRQARKTGEQLASDLLTNYKTGGEISKELTTAQSMKIGKNLYFTATKKGDIGLTKVIYPKESTGVKILKGGGTKTPLSQIYKEETKAILGISKSLEKPVSKITKPLTENIIETIPSGISTSTYAGLGVYERYAPSQNIFVTPIKAPVVEGKLGEGNIPSLTGSGSIDNLGVTGKYGDLGVAETGFEGLGVSEVERTRGRKREKTREEEGLESAGSLLTGIVNAPSTKEEEATALIQPQKQKELTKQKQETQLIMISPLLRLQPRIIYPEESLGFGLGLGLPKRQKKKSTKKYVTELRRRGQFITVSKPTSIGEAIGIGIEKVKSTLGASFRVREETGKVVPLSLTSPEFRKSGKEEGVIIQRRGFRLSSQPERKEIQRAKVSKLFGF